MTAYFVFAAWFAITLAIAARCDRDFIDKL
jgi:hypothetical protein